MPRIFTIRFSYQNSEATALVKERVLPLGTEYSLSMIGGELEELLEDRKILLLPTGTIAFSKQEGLPGRLMETVLQAIAHHVGTAAA
ncbi:MAG: hypothetical protein EOO08_15245 [Chitinophagaceae bacterium]|nr:MAG: hypothetical protein EOO08_15245 [Chitinophagaceae bacterium]